MATAIDCIPQAAVIPFRSGRICLVTSRSRRNRWVIPKGRMEADKTAGEIALQEAWEEAGLAGVLCGEPIGSYFYEKWGSTYHVTVFVMQVTEVAADWPESSERRRRWWRPGQAVLRLEEEGLREIIRAASEQAVA